MRRFLIIGLAAMTLAAAATWRVWACGQFPGSVHAGRAVSANADLARDGIARLREMGPAGLDVLMTTHAAAIAQHKADPTNRTPEWDRLSAALDAVAKQKDAWAAGLYWYTDFDEAQRVAKETNKPILSLRLLGTLDTEFSCANSRFFRTALYPDAAVGKELREHFVLHWQTHRPVPRLTIDFGDGRKIERTITGNSVHYVLAPDGRVVDVIPGLYGPAAFCRALTEARDAVALATAPNAAFDAVVTSFHANQLNALQRAWEADRNALGIATVSGVITLNGGSVPPGVSVQPVPTAMAATKVAVSKGFVETKPLIALGERPAATTDDTTWSRIAALHAKDSKLGEASRAVILSKSDAAAANRLTFAKSAAETPALRVVRNFERSIAEDTVRNEYLFHGQIHEWFVRRQVPASLNDLNEKVYAQLFLMPSSDPWLGLVPPNTYTALPADAR